MGERVGGASGHVTIVYLSSLDEVTSVRQSGCMLPDKLMMVSNILSFFRENFFLLQTVDACIEGCLRSKQRMKDTLCS